jgi:hypothetical protein
MFPSVLLCNQLCLAQLNSINRSKRVAIIRYVSAGQVRDLWCPVLYRVAVHHVTTFIAEQPDTSIAHQLSARILQLGNKVNTAVHVTDIYITFIRVYSCLFCYLTNVGSRIGSEFE